MFDLENHIEVCLTSIFNANRRSLVIYLGLFEILDLENVEINTKIKSVAMACIHLKMEELIKVYV